MSSTENRYLEITYRHGKTVAAYFSLPRLAGDVCSRTVPGKAGLVIDYAVDGRAIGIEITSPSTLTLTALNEALGAVHQPPATPDDISPLLVNRQRSSAAG